MADDNPKKEKEAIHLDLKDRKILYELDINARQSYSQIGKKIGLSKDLVNYRIKQLEKSGLIKGYYTVIDIAKLGYLDFRVFLKFYNVTPKKEREIMDYLKNNPRVGWLVSVEGRFDSNMLVWAESVFEYRKFWKEFMKKYRNYIEDKWVSVITELIHYRKAFLLGKEKDDSEPEIAGGELSRDIDELDWRLLQILATDARASLLEIAKKLNVSAKVIAYRIKQLTRKKVILSFRALLDLDLLGIQYYKVHFTLQNMTEEKENSLFSYARYHPNVVLVDVTVGGADFEIELYVKDNRQFHEIIADIKEKFSDIIRDYESFLYYKEYKWIYLPKQQSI